MLVLVDLGSHKRAREDGDILMDAKKPRLEEPPSSTNLEEALSDISDDPDEILNREDIVSTYSFECLKCKVQFYI